MEESFSSSFHLQIFNILLFVDDRIQKSPKNNMFWITRLYSADDSTQRVWNVQIILELWSWFYNDEKNIGKYSIKQFEKSVKKSMYI